MKRKIIFFDIDGTLYGHNRGVSSLVKDAIKNTQKKGHLCFIASGRPYGFIAKPLKEMSFDGYVLANGAHIKYKDENLIERHLDENHLKEMIQYFKAKQIEYVLQTRDYCYIDKDQKDLLQFYTRCHIDFENFCYEFDEEEIIKRTVKVEAWVKNEEEYQYVISHLQNFSYELHPDHHSMEIYSPVVSKSTGIKDVLKYFDISVDDSYCFGDGPNDVTMFETVGHPIAMGNALDIIKEKAEDVCLSVDEDGVAYKLMELFE